MARTSAAPLEAPNKTSAPIMFFGDPARNPEELVRGHPFGGKAGKIFRDAVESAGYKERDYTASFCAVPVGDFEELKGKHLAEMATVTSIPKIVANRPFVVVTVGADALRVLGDEKKISVYAGKPFAHVFKTDSDEHECIVYPLVNPGYILYNDHLMEDYYKHFASIREIAQSYDKKATELKEAFNVNYRAITTFAAAKKRLRFFTRMGLKGIPISWDLETSHLKPHSKGSVIGVLSISHKVKTASVFVWEHEEVVWSDDEKRRWLKLLGKFFALSKPKSNPYDWTGRIKFVTQNGKFDCQWIYEKTGVMPILYADTMLMHHILDERKGTHGLKVQAVDIGMGAYEDELHEYIDDPSEPFAFLKPPLHVITKYGGSDSDCALRLFYKHKEKIDKKETYKRLAYRFTTAASELLSYVEHAGAKVDLAWIKDAKNREEKICNDLLQQINSNPHVRKFVKGKARIQQEDYEAYLAERKKEWRKAFKEWKAYKLEQRANGKPVSRKKPVLGEGRWKFRAQDDVFSFNVNSPDQLRAVLFDYIGHEPHMETESGLPSTNKESLVAFKNDHKCDFSRTLLDYRIHSKVLGTYLNSFYEKCQGYSSGHYIYPSYHITGTETARLASSGPSLQQTPQGSKGAPVKRSFVSRFKGGHLANYDYSQIELRLAASFSRDPVMMKIYKEGGDIHKATCCAIFGLTPEEYEELPKDEKKEKRRIAKVYNFGIIYGMGPSGIIAALAKDDPPVHLTDDEARDQYEKFRKGYKGLFAWIEEVKNFIREKAFYSSPFGHRRRLPQVNSVDEEEVARALRQGVNFTVQSAASQMTLLSSIIIRGMMAERGMKSVLWNLVHDALMFDVYPGEQDALDEIVKDVMTNLPKYGNRIMGDDFKWDWIRVPIEIGADYGYNWRDFIELGSEIENKKTGKKEKLDNWRKCLAYSKKVGEEADKEYNMAHEKADEITDGFKEAAAEALGEEEEAA